MNHSVAVRFQGDSRKFWLFCPSFSNITLPLGFAINSEIGFKRMDAPKKHTCQQLSTAMYENTISFHLKASSQGATKADEEYDESKGSELPNISLLVLVCLINNQLGMDNECDVTHKVSKP